MSDQKVWHRSKFDFMVDERRIRFRGDFDNGNLESVVHKGFSLRKDQSRQKIPHFMVRSYLDCNKLEDVTCKSFFHFCVENYPINKPIYIEIVNVKLLMPLQKSGKLNYYRPFIKMGLQKSYQRLLPQQIQIIQNNTLQQNTIDIHLKLLPTQSIFYLSFASPYPYTQYLNYIQHLPTSQSFYLKKQILSYSLELRPIYLITISSFDKMQDSDDPIGGQNNRIIFPQKTINQKRKSFNKPAIIISARVHPGQSSSSYGMEGIIEFLISNDLRAYIIRKHFQILLVPMLNPDGVYHGFYRLDTLGQNLNRYYTICNQKQPSIYSFRHLINYFEKQKKLMLFIDLHGHPSNKGSFLYGNSFEEILYQTESQLFAKVMQINSRTFQYKACNFSKSQQKNTKNITQQYSKQGCARVYVYRNSNIIHSYTFQLGFHFLQQLNPKNLLSNTNFRHPDLPQFKLIYQQPDQFLLTDQNLNNQIIYYTPQIYRYECINLLISFLDILELNPYSRIESRQENFVSIKKKIAKDLFQKCDSFRIFEKNANLKIAHINQFYEQNILKKIREKSFLYENSKYWPSNVNFQKYIPIVQLHKKLHHQIKHPIEEEKKQIDFYETMHAQQNKRQRIEEYKEKNQKMYIDKYHNNQSYCLNGESKQMKFWIMNTDENNKKNVSICNLQKLYENDGIIIKKLRNKVQNKKDQNKFSFIKFIPLSQKKQQQKHKKQQFKNADSKKMDIQSIINQTQIIPSQLSIKNIKDNRLLKYQNNRHRNTTKSKLKQKVILNQNQLSQQLNTFDDSNMKKKINYKQKNLQYNKSHCLHDLIKNIKDQSKQQRIASAFLPQHKNNQSDNILQLESESIIQIDNKQMEYMNLGQREGFSVELGIQKNNMKEQGNFFSANLHNENKEQIPFLYMNKKICGRLKSTDEMLEEYQNVFNIQKKQQFNELEAQINQFNMMSKVQNAYRHIFNVQKMNNKQYLKILKLPQIEISTKQKNPIKNMSNNYKNTSNHDKHTTSRKQSNSIHKNNTFSINKHNTKRISLKL